MASEIGDEESDDKQAFRCCSILVSIEKISEQSMQNFAKFIFIIYEQLGQLMPIEEIRSKKKRSINLFDSNNFYQTPSIGKTSYLDKNTDKSTIQSTGSISVVVSEIVSIFSQKESSIYSLPNIKIDHNQPNPYIEFTFIHNKFGLQDNLTNFRCVQLQDSETIPYSINSNSKVLSVEQAALAVTNELNQAGSNQVSTSMDHRFLAQSSACQTISTNLTQTTCRCTSLGTFTVLADLGGNEEANQLTIQERIQLMLKLNRICIFSCAICAVLLLITIISFYFHKSNLRSTKTINHLLFLRNNQSQLPGHLTKAVNYQNILLSNQAKINFLICLLFLECSMLISLGLSESGQNNQVFCRFASLAIHYFILTVFSWLLFDCFISSYLLVFTETRQHQQNQTNFIFSQAQPLVVLNANGFTTTTTTSSLDLQNSTRQYTLHTCKLLTYLLPLFIVVLSSWIDPSSYCSKSWSTQSLNSIQQQSSILYAICWHQFDNIYIMFFVVPLIALLLASFVFIALSLALRFRMKRSNNQQQTNKQFTFLSPSNQLNADHKSQDQQTKSITSNDSLFASNTKINLFNVLITSCCWLFASFYLNNLLETFENFHFNNQLVQQFEQQQHQSTYAEPLLTSNSFTRTFTQLPDSNLAVFAFLFVLFNIVHCLILLIKLAIRNGLIGQCCSPMCIQFTNICLFKSKQSSLNSLSQLYMPPSYCYNGSGDNQTNSANLDTLKYDQKQQQFNLNKFEQNDSNLSSMLANQVAAQQQPLIPPPQLIKYQFNQTQKLSTLNRQEEDADDDVYENEDQQTFLEHQSNSETMLANSDLQTSEQSDSEQFQLNRNKATFSDVDQFGGAKEFLLKKNNVYGHPKNIAASTRLNQSIRSQMENFYECIEDNNGSGANTLYEPMVYSAAYGDNSQTSFIQNKYNRFMNASGSNQQHSDLDSEYENPIERFQNRSTRVNKLLRNYSSNDFLTERDSPQSRLDQPLLAVPLPAIIRDNTNNNNSLQFHNLSASTNQRIFKRPQFNSPTRFNPINSSFASTIGRNEILLTNSANGLRTNFRGSHKQTKEMINEQEQNLKQIQQQLKQFQLQLAINNTQQQQANLQTQEEELKDRLNGQSQQQNYLSSNSSVSDNVNSSV